MFEAFESMNLQFSSRDPSLIGLTVTEMTEMNMMIDARPSYPSNKLTLNIANLTRDKAIRYLVFYVNLNQQYDIDVILEDSKRGIFKLF